MIRYLDLFKISGYSLTAAAGDRLPFHFTQIGRWQDKNEELDVMALDSTKRQILLGECKYRNAPFDLAEFHHMRSKYAPPVQDAAIYYCLFSKAASATNCGALRRRKDHVVRTGRNRPSGRGAVTPAFSDFSSRFFRVVSIDKFKLVPLVVLSFKGERRLRSCVH